MTKKLRRFFKFCSFVVLSVSFSGYVVAYTSPGHPTGFVDDFAQVFTVEQKTNLESKLRVFNASTTNEIAVVTIKSLEGDYIEHYASELFKEWQIGKAKQDNGVLLLVAMDDHKMRIEVGYGLEGALTDARSSQIIRDDLTPAFKQNDFYGGIEKAIDDIMKATKGEYAQTTTQPPSKIHFSFDIWVIILIIAAQFISFIASLFARSKSWWAGGVVGGILGIVITLLGVFGITLIIGGTITLVLVLLGLLFDFIVSGTYASSVRSGGGIPWWIGGRGFGGGSSSGGSFGGFGGGSSGGGGASGSW